MRCWKDQKLERDPKRVQVEAQHEINRPVRRVVVIAPDGTLVNVRVPEQDNGGRHERRGRWVVFSRYASGRILSQKTNFLRSALFKEATMTTIKAVVRNGRIETEGPIDLPDGTELAIPIPMIPTVPGNGDQDGPDTPEAIAAWLRWYEALEPLSFTPEERAAWEAARCEQKQYELEQWERRSRLIEEHFP